MTSLRLATWRIGEAWRRTVATSRPWVLAVYSVFLPLFWVGCLRVGPSLYATLQVYDGGRMALLAAALAPCVWLALFTQRLYAMPSRAGSWLANDFHFLLSLPLPLPRVLFATAALWTFGDLPLLASTLALLQAFFASVGLRPATAAACVVLFYWMVMALYLCIALGRLIFHRHTGWRHRLWVAAVAGLALVVIGQVESLPGPDAPQLATAWQRHAMSEPPPEGLVERAAAALEPALQTYRRVAPAAEWLPPCLLFRGLLMLDRGDAGWWRPLGGAVALLVLLTAVPLALAEPLCRRDRLALVHVGDESEGTPASGRAAASGPMRERLLQGLDAKEFQLWANFWTGPAALAVVSCAGTWYLLSSGYTILAAAKMLGLLTWMVGSLAGDSLGWERRGLVLCQLLPVTPLDILSAKARWAAMAGVACLVVPFAGTCIAMDAEPFGELMRGVLILTFLAFVAAHAGVALGALLRDLAGQGQPGMGPMLGALLWMGLCGAMVAQVFFTSGYSVFGGLFFDVLLVVALWQRACVQLRYQYDPEETPGRETVFADSVMIFLTTYLLVAVIVLQCQARGYSDGALTALRTYLLTSLFPLILAALTWLQLRQLPPPASPPSHSLASDLKAAGAMALLTVAMTLSYSYGTTRLGWLVREDLGVGVRMMRDMVAGLPMAPLLLLLLMGVLAPLAEEAFFRGLFYRGLRSLQPHDYRIAVLLSSLAFGLLHPAAHFPILFTMGTMLAVLVERRGSLRPAILAHSAHNTVMAVLFLAS